MSKDVKDTEAQEELKDKVNAGDVKEEKETKEKHAKAKKEDKDQKIEELGQKLSEINDKYLRLSAEFDNYRKRTLKERMAVSYTHLGRFSIFSHPQHFVIISFFSHYFYI